MTNDEGWSGWSITVAEEIDVRVDQNEEGRCEVTVFINANNDQLNYQAEVVL